jgi:hypothetical protein
MQPTHSPGTDQRHIMDFHQLIARLGTIVPSNNEFGIGVNGF